MSIGGGVFYYYTGKQAVTPYFMKHFPEVLVVQTLRTNNIPEDKIQNIAKTLVLNELNIEKNARAIGAKRARNPFDFPPDIDDMLELLYEEAYETFSDSLISNGISDKKQIELSFDELQKLKLRNYGRYNKKQ